MRPAFLLLLLNVVVTSGGLPPVDPPRQAPTREQLYDALIREMEQALAQLEALIRSKNIKLLLVFDLDGALYHYPAGESPQYTEGLQILTPLSPVMVPIFNFPGTGWIKSGLVGCRQ